MAPPPLPSHAPRSALLKSLLRLVRSTRTELRLLLAKPGRRRPHTLPLLVLLALVSLLTLLMLRNYLFPALSADWVDSQRIEHPTNRSAQHAAPDPRRRDACSWLYLEWNAKDGRHVRDFVRNSGSFMEEHMRATQSIVHGYCVVAFDANRALKPDLVALRDQYQRRTHRFQVHPGVVPAVADGMEHVQFADANDPSRRRNDTVQTVDLAATVQKLTFPYRESGYEHLAMRSAVSNGNRGNVVVRINAFDIREAYMHLIQLQASDASGIMCDRIDRLVINLERVTLVSKHTTNDSGRDEDVLRDWSRIMPAAPSREYDARNTIDGLQVLAREISQRAGCRTVVHVINQQRQQLWPVLLSERAIYYSVLAGAPTFNERVRAQTNSWVTAIAKDRLTFFTNVERKGSDRDAARDWRLEVVKPTQPQLEQRLHMMQSWSHLVRLRETWDRYMKDDASIQWLALVDDDTFVYPAGMRQYLTQFDARQMLWGGHGEQVRVDNGDGGKFAAMLREKMKTRGGEHCYLPGEPMGKNLKAKFVEYTNVEGKKVKRKTSYMCSDTFCSLGCAGVPQGAAILVSRALVEALRPFVEQCEEETSKLCKNCGSQRLYMCVNFYQKEARTLMMRGICRSPWKLEKRERFPFILTYHGFTRYKGFALSTDSIDGDMGELWRLGREAEERVRKGLSGNFLTSTQKVADLIGCGGKGSYRKGVCIGGNGIEFGAKDKPDMSVFRRGSKRAH